MQERIIANSVLDPESVYAGSSCWLWLGKRRPNRSGMFYGFLTMRFKSGPRKGKVHNAAVHRLVVEVFKGRRVTPRMVVMHLCNNTLCCNPEHLLGGSQKKNVQQCVKDGRHKTPFRHPEMAVAL
ncbi:MAG: HNH endonuclease [Pseudomonadota bacterium]